MIALDSLRSGSKGTDSRVSKARHGAPRGRRNGCADSSRSPDLSAPHSACRSAPRDLNTVVFLIESSPANLDPRVGTDAQSQRIDALLFDGLVARDAKFQFTPALAERWEQPNPTTLIFHLRSDVRFHDGRPLTSRDVLWTLNSMLDSKRPGGVITPKAASYASIDTMDAPDDHTVILHLKHAGQFPAHQSLHRRHRHRPSWQRPRLL